MKNDQLRVVHVIPSLGRGGAERLVLDFVETTQKLFPEVVCCVVVLSDIDEYSKAYPTIHIKKIPTTCPISISGRSKPEIDNFHAFIESFQPTIIHSHIYFADLVSHYRVLDGVKYVSHIHGRTKQLEPFPVHGWTAKESYTNEVERRFITKQFKRTKTNFIAITEYQKKEFLRFNSFARLNLSVILNAIDLNLFRPIPKSINDTKLKLVNVGRLDGNKNHFFLLDVIELLIQEGVEVELQIIGDGEEIHNLVHRISDKKLDKNVFVLGTKNNPEHYLQQAHIYIHAAKIEAFGLTLIESVACGTPVIFTDGKGNTELFKNADVGTIIWDNSPKTMADAIIKLFQDKQRYTNEQIKGLEFAKSFGIEEFSKNLVDYYLRLLK